MPTLYADASALVKLVRDERESAALRTYLAGSTLVTSVLARVEVGRAARRIGAEAAGIPDAAIVVELDDKILAAAVELTPPTLRALDAIHLATALTFRGELDAFVAYDDRLLEAARANGLETASPA